MRKTKAVQGTVRSREVKAAEIKAVCDWMFS